MHRSAQKRHLTLNSGMKQKGEHIREPQHAKRESKFTTFRKGLLRHIAGAFRWVVSTIAGGILFEVIKALVGF